VVFLLPFFLPQQSGFFPSQKRDMVGKYYDSEDLRERNDPSRTNIPCERHQFRCGQYLGEMEFIWTHVHYEEVVTSVTSFQEEVSWGGMGEQQETSMLSGATDDDKSAELATKLKAAEARIRKLESLLVQTI